MGRLIITSGPIYESAFTADLMNLEDLVDFVDEQRIIRRKEVMSNIVSKRPAT